MRIVVMGVSGSGKSTVGAALAARLDAPFCDGDDLHPQANVAKMSAGVALTDEDRWPWLDLVGEWLANHDTGVMACSALRRVYRDRIRAVAPDTLMLHLVAPDDTIARRQAARVDHFMPASLMASQLALLEPLDADEPGIAVDVRGTVEQIVEQAYAALSAT